MRISYKLHLKSAIRYVPLKDSKYKSLEQRFQNVPFFDNRLFLCHAESLTHRSATEITQESLHLRDEVSK